MCISKGQRNDISRKLFKLTSLRKGQGWLEQVSDTSSKGTWIFSGVLLEAARRHAKVGPVPQYRGLDLGHYGPRVIS